MHRAVNQCFAHGSTLCREVGGGLVCSLLFVSVVEYHVVAAILPPPHHLSLIPIWRDNQLPVVIEDKTIPHSLHLVVWKPPLIPLRHAAPAPDPSLGTTTRDFGSLNDTELHRSYKH